MLANASRTQRVGRIAAIAAASLAVATAWAAPAMAQWKPTRQVELVIPTNPGSGIGNQARLMQKIMTEEKLVDVPVIAVNKPGGGESVGFAYVAEHKGDAEYIGMAALQLVSNKITGQNPISNEDVTPLAVLGVQPVAVTVRADSDIKSAEDLVARLKEDPAALSIGFASGRGNAVHISLALAMQKLGVDAKALRLVVFGSSGESRAAVLGGHVDAMASPVSAVAQSYEAGEVRILAIGTDKRANAPLDDVPTWKELGADTAFGIFYGVIAPPGLSDDQVAYWDDVFTKLAATSAWREAAASSYLASIDLVSADSQTFWAQAAEDAAVVLKDLGLAK